MRNISLHKTGQKARWNTKKAFSLSENVRVNISLFRTTRTRTSIYINVIDSLSFIIGHFPESNYETIKIELKGDLSQLNEKVKNKLQSKISNEEIDSCLLNLSIVLFCLLSFNFTSYNNIADAEIKIDIPEIVPKLNNDLMNEISKILVTPNSKTICFVKNLLKNGGNNLKNIINIECLNNLIDNFSSLLNDDSASELNWQNFLAANSIIISQIFSEPVIAVKSQFKINGEKAFDSSGIVDFLFSNKLLGSASLIEIKKPQTILLENGEYRNNKLISKDLIGGIVQLQKYKDELMHKQKDFGGDFFQTFNPKLVLIIGKIESLSNSDDKRTFELFRTQIKDMEILTFDELLERIKTIKSLFSNEKTNEIEKHISIERKEK